ncbi:NAD(P)-binding domain-containing protein, partial [Sinomonas sp. G460-2]|uniref:NAD(P)-binding domain-containing protein n=1 Tax=Sinomonas sp. G460-2 TaxID=3393464 RepID=UPI0039EE68C7
MTETPMRHSPYTVVDTAPAGSLAAGSTDVGYTVAILGLGAMGLPMASRLATGLTVNGFDIAPERLELARAAGV